MKKATPYATFVAITKPKTETSSFWSKKKYTAVLTTMATVMESAAYCGLPCAVKQADNVCAQESVNALTDSPLTR